MIEPNQARNRSRIKLNQDDLYVSRNLIKQHASLNTLHPHTQLSLSSIVFMPDDFVHLYLGDKMGYLEGNVEYLWN